MFLDDPPIYTSFIHRFCSLFVKFYRKPCKLHGDKLTCSWCLVIKFNNRLRDVTSVEHYVGQSADVFIYGVTHVNHSLSSTGPKKGHQRQLLASRYFNCQINYMPLFSQIKPNHVREMCPVPPPQPRPGICRYRSFLKKYLCLYKIITCIIH